MNREQFLNHEVINKNNQKGIVISFNERYIVIRYQDGDKTYNPDLAFKNGFLSFVGNNLNSLISNDLQSKDNAKAQKEKAIQKTKKEAIQRVKWINDRYQKLMKKWRYLKELFGSDFIYPPLEEFKKQYGPYINKTNALDMLFNVNRKPLKYLDIH